MMTYETFKAVVDHTVTRTNQRVQFLALCHKPGSPGISEKWKIQLEDLQAPNPLGVLPSAEVLRVTVVNLQSWCTRIYEIGSLLNSMSIQNFGPNAINARFKQLLLENAAKGGHGLGIKLATIEAAISNRISEETDNETARHEVYDEIRNYIMLFFQVFDREPLDENDLTWQQKEAALRSANKRQKAAEKVTTDALILKKPRTHMVPSNAHSLSGEDGAGLQIPVITRDHRSQDAEKTFADESSVMSSFMASHVQEKIEKKLSRIQSEIAETLFDRESYSDEETFENNVHPLLSSLGISPNKIARVHSLSLPRFCDEWNMVCAALKPAVAAEMLESFKKEGKLYTDLNK